MLVNLINDIKEVISENKKRSIIIIIMLVFLLLLVLWPKESGKNKVYKNSSYVITYETTKIDDITSKMPYINLKGEDIESTNSLLMQKYYECEALNDRYIEYEYYANDNILSLIVKIYKLEDDFIPSEMYFYNFNIENGKALTNIDLKRKFGVNDTFIKERLITLTKKYYDYEVTKGYIDKKVCDFDCYQEFFGEDYFSSLEYYVKNNSLYTYFYFDVDNNFAYDSSKPFDIFRFKIK